MEPFGTIEPTYMLAQLSALIINCFSAFGGAKRKLITINDFIPKWGEVVSKKGEPRQSVEEQKAILLGLTKSIKPKTKRREIK